MGERWLTRPGGVPHAGRTAGVLLALAAFGQAAGQAVTLGFSAGKGADPGLLAFLYAVPLCGLALLSTVPLLFLRPLWAAVVVVCANVVVLGAFPAPTVAGVTAAVFAVWRLGMAGSLDYLAVGLALPFVALALVRHGDVVCLLLASAVPVAAGAGIALRAGRMARTYSEAGEALADTLVAHTARGERARIARELHDVVAHHISMIAVLAETGRLATPGLPEAGARRFLEIGDTARAGLTEMRRLLGVLREDAAGAGQGTAGTGQGTAGTGQGTAGDAAADRQGRPPAAAPDAGGGPAAAGDGGAAGDGARASRQPQPGLAQLTGLVDAAREASVAGARLIISGPVAPLDPGVELAAYRIVQEALTNARRHAPGAAVDVELRYSPGSLRVRVRDNGPGPVTVPDAGGLTSDGLTAGGGRPGGPGSGSGPVRAPTGSQPGGGRPGGGHGLLGMRERAFSVGGALYAGASPGGGFLVEAVLPSGPDPVRAVHAAATTDMTTAVAGTAGAAGGTGGDR